MLRPPPGWRPRRRTRSQSRSLLPRWTTAPASAAPRRFLRASAHRPMAPPAGSTEVQNMKPVQGEDSVSRSFERGIIKKASNVHGSPVITARKRSLRRLCFYRCLSVHTGGGGVRGFIRGGRVWFYSGGACVLLFGGACVLLFGGRAWFYEGVCVVLFGGACMVLFGGMHGFIWGACMVLFGGHAWFYSRGCAWF